MKKSIPVLITIAVIITCACEHGTKKRNTINDKAEILRNDESSGIKLPDGEKKLINSYGVEIFLIGQQIPFDATNYVINKVSETFEEGIEEPNYTVLENEQLMFRIRPEYDYKAERFTDKVGEITVLTDKFKTREDISVGSGIQDFIQQYPDFTIWYTYISDMFVIETKQYNNIQFLLDNDDYTGEKLVIDGDMTILKLSDFNKYSKIKSIRIF